MKTLDQWFDEYAVSHQNATNIGIHYICVPAIFFSILGFLLCIPNGFLLDLFSSSNSLLFNWASVAIVFLFLFYVRLSLVMALKIVVFSVFCLVINYFIGLHFTLWLFSLVVFVIAWFGQFYGHKIEGIKPSFLKDIQFLMIGPAWVLKKLFG